jgi:hypothetical protein
LSKDEIKGLPQDTFTKKYLAQFTTFALSRKQNIIIIIIITALIHRTVFILFLRIRVGLDKALVSNNAANKDIKISNNHRRTGKSLNWSNSLKVIGSSTSSVETELARADTYAALSSSLSSSAS